MMSKEEANRIACAAMEALVDIMRNGKNAELQRKAAVEIMTRAWGEEMNYVIELLKERQTGLSCAIRGSQEEEAHYAAELEAQKLKTACLKQNLASVERALAQLTEEQ